MKDILWWKSSRDESYLVKKVVQWWNLSSDESWNYKSEKEWWLVTFRLWRCFSIGFQVWVQESWAKTLDVLALDFHLSVSALNLLGLTYSQIPSWLNALWLICNGEVIMINFHFWQKTVFIPHFHFLIHWVLLNSL